MSQCGKAQRVGSQPKASPWPPGGPAGACRYFLTKFHPRRRGPPAQGATGLVSLVSLLPAPGVGRGTWTWYTQVQPREVAKGSQGKGPLRRSGTCTPCRPPPAAWGPGPKEACLFIWTSAILERSERRSQGGLDCPQAAAAPRLVGAGGLCLFFWDKSQPREVAPQGKGP